jgi:ribosomal-protein-alanine N-acetyltransferase
MKLETKRILLISGTPVIGRAEIEDRMRFAKLLNAEVSTKWPPPLNDKESMMWFTEYMENNPDANGWASWYFLLKTESEKPIAIGNGGFKGKPNDNGQVEICYSFLEDYHGKGYATEAVNALIEFAFSRNYITRIIAQTLSDLQPSIRVLEKCGFSYVGEGTEEGAILYQLLRENFIFPT